MSTDANAPTALVVGGSRGAGRTIALRLAAGGTKTLVLGRDAERLDQLVAAASAFGGTIIPVRTDLLKTSECTDALETAARDHGYPAIFVHCAAALYTHQRLHTVELSEIDRLLDTDLRSAIYLTRWALAAMSAARFGRIIYLGSLASQQGIPGATMYATAKAGLEGLCRGVALDYGTRGITANTIALGMLETERLAERTANDPEARDRLLSLTTTKAFIQPEEIAELVCFLCGPFGRSITGSVVEMSAGAHLRVAGV